MITAKQAREKQLTINWRDNEKAVKAYKKEKEEMLKEIEEEIHNALIGDEKYITYFIFSKKLHNLTTATSSAEHNLARTELVEDIEKELVGLGYEVENVHSLISCESWWKIEW